MPTPSAQIAPSAASAKERQRPVADSPRWRLNSMNGCGVAITVTPPASASAHCPERNAPIARCRVTREEEQAVSTVTAGPRKPRV